MPHELHRHVTNFLSPVDYISYREAVGEEIVGSYVGAKLDVQSVLRAKMKEKQFANYYRNEWEKNETLTQSDWDFLLLLLGTGQVDLSETMENNRLRKGFKISFANLLLCAATKLNRLDIMRLLLDKQWNQDHLDLSKLLAHYLHFPRRNFHIATFVELMLADERVDPSANYNLAIRWASSYGHHESVSLLLADSGVDPSACDNYAIRLASYNGHHECVSLLLADSRVDPTANLNWAIRMAAQYHHPECLRLLIADSRVDPAADDNSAIRKASEYGYIECLRLLITDLRVDPTAIYNSAIRMAAQNGHLECLRLLMADSRVDPSAFDNSAIRMAAQNGHLECLRLLIADSRVTLSANDNEAIEMAERNGPNEWLSYV